MKHFNAWITLMLGWLRFRDSNEAKFRLHLFVLRICFNFLYKIFVMSMPESAAGHLIQATVSQEFMESSRLGSFCRESWFKLDPTWFGFTYLHGSGWPSGSWSQQALNFDQHRMEDWWNLWSGVCIPSPLVSITCVSKINCFNFFLGALCIKMENNID